MLQTFVLALAAGAVLLVCARRLRFPAIGPLLVGGVLLGPELLDVVRPAALENGLEPLIQLAVAVILFEGGLSLNFEGARVVPAVIGRLVSRGAIITWLGAALLLLALMNLPLKMALLVGSLTIVTGPTVVTPILRRIRVNERVHNVLHWEAVLIDPIGVFIALLCYQWVTLEQTYLAAIGELALRTITGTAIGVVGGWLFGQALKRRIMPREYVNITMLAGALLLYALADLVLAHTGILAVTISGFVLGWLKPPALDDLKSFKLQITELAVAVVFVLLAADLELGSFVDLGLSGFAVVALLVLVVRPLGVLASTWGSALTLRERIFISWIAPRGIVAASMASLFARELALSGRQDTSIVESFIFAVIAVTVLLQGSTAGAVGAMLGVRKREYQGWLIVGAGAFGRGLAQIFDANRVPVVLVDQNESAVRAAQEGGLDAFEADALDVDLPNDPRLAAIGSVLCATDNGAANRLIARQWANQVGVDHAHVWGDLLADRSLRQSSAHSGDHDFFGRVTAINRGLDLGETELREVEGDGNPLPRGVRPLFAVADGKAVPLTSHKSRTKEKRVVLQWAHPDEDDLFQAVTFLDPRPADLISAYRALAGFAGSQVPIDAEAVVTDLVDRERRMSMVIGGGVAVPHTVEPRVENPMCFVGIVPGGIAVEEVDPVRAIFLLLSPPGAAGRHLAALATISRWARSGDRIERVLTSSSPAEAMAQLVGYSRCYSAATGA